MSADPLDDAIDKAWREIQSLHQRPYDGVLGELPDWIPENFRREFVAVRGRLLETYSHDDLLQFIAEVQVTLDPDLSTSYRPLTPFYIMREVSILAQLQQAVRLGKGAGLALLTDPEHAGRVKKGEDYSLHQAGIARKPRGKIDNHKTLSEFIGELALSIEHKAESAKELWPHLYSELDTLGLNPKEFKHPNDLKKNCYCYDFNSGRKRITFGQFAKVISTNRKRKLP